MTVVSTETQEKYVSQLYCFNLKLDVIVSVNLYYILQMQTLDSTQH